MGFDQGAIKRVYSSVPSADYAEEFLLEAVQRIRIDWEANANHRTTRQALWEEANKEMFEMAMH